MSAIHFPSSIVQTSAAATGVAAVRNAGPILEIPGWAYTLVAVAVALLGVYLARLVTIDAENKQLGRRQTLRETMPLTLIGVLIVCPLVWHFNVAIPWASLIGLGAGYSVQVILKILGSGAVAAARAMAENAATTLRGDAGMTKRILDAPGAVSPAVILPPQKPDPAQSELLDRLSHTPEVPGKPESETRDDSNP